jgi:hypothetical protein
VPELIPRFHRRMQELADARKIGKLLLEVDAEAPPDANGRVYRLSADGHNHDRRCGPPVISRGASGTSPGSDPVSALLRKESRHRR